jgi:flavin-dependent dehydrogenase
LDLGGFGISRFAFDNFLYRIARNEGVEFQLNTEVNAINFSDDQFVLETTEDNFLAEIVIGAFGKRSKIDVQQNRNFIKKRSPYLGIKYHIRSNHPLDVIALHNFEGGYCGICNVEDGITNLCYLTRREQLKKFGDISEMERAILFQNPVIRRIFQESGFIFKKPEVINEISFETKGPVENHILIAGDAAGMITPVCGNGMAMAIHSGKMLAEHVTEYCAGRISRTILEQRYSKAWKNQFSTRLWVGRNVQRLFGRSFFSSLAVNMARSSKKLANFIISETHGKAF